MAAALLGAAAIRVSGPSDDSEDHGTTMTDDTLDSIPPTEPVKLPIRKEAPPAKKKPQTRKMPEKRATLDASSFVPDLDARSPSINEEYCYWIGALPSCPSEHIDLCGIHFPKVTEWVTKARDGGPSQRIPKIGQVVRLNKAQILKLQDRLSRTIIRFRSAKPANFDNGVGSTFQGVEGALRRKGSPVTIPTKQELEARVAAGLPARSYTRQAFDEPAADYLFAQLCDDQDSGSRGEAYPEPLSATGIVWPGELQEA